MKAEERKQAFRYEIILNSSFLPPLFLLNTIPERKVNDADGLV